MTTRREFIKILTGTVIAISLPLGLFSKTETPVDFIIENVSIFRLEKTYEWCMRGLAIPKDKRIKIKYFAIKIDDIGNYNKQELLREVKFNLIRSFKGQGIFNNPF